MDHTRVKKRSAAGLLTAVAVVGSLFSFPVLGSQCAPVQHMVNIICAVCLGPWYGVGVAFAASLIRNLLGLGNAATPLGIEAVRRMERKTPGTASDAMCMLVVCNTASIQLIPATVASIRQAAGSGAAFDILPAVWLASAVSVTVGIVAAKVMARMWRE